MQSTLVVAQETADEVKKSSLQKAQVLTRETELACNKQKEAAVSFCNKLRADTEAEITRMKSEAEAYAEKVRKMADEYASKTRGEADDYGKSTRTDADSYALGLRSKTDSSTSKLREEAQSFVDKMKNLAEIEVARMKVEAEDNCKSQLADSREQARTLTAEASAHANHVIQHKRKPGISEFCWIVTGPCLGAVRKHNMQQPANLGLRVIKGDAYAGAQSIAYQYGRTTADLVIRHADFDQVCHITQRLLL